MKILTWNVNGLRSVYRSGFLDFVAREKPDIFCLQETKIQVGQLAKLETPRGYFLFANCAKRPGYSGVVIYLKRRCLTRGVKHLEKSIGLRRFDDEGRFLQLGFPKFILINLYLPHGSRDKSQLEYKLEVYHFLHKYLARLKKKPVIVFGDFNIAYQEIDLARPRENKNNIMFTPEERKQIDELIDIGFIDAFRVFHKEGGNYTWLTYFKNAREKGLGWRIDYCFISRPLLTHLKDAFILDKATLGSDHCPSGIELEF